MHYAYCPADVAITSVHELRMRRWDMQPRQRIMNDEIVDGEDQLGVLLLGHDYTGWWTGSLLSIEEARALVPGQNATTLQVAASIVAAVTWMIDHPDAGVRVPDELPWEPVLAVARKYLGTCHSDAIEWTPLQARRALDLFPNFGTPPTGWISTTRGSSATSSCTDRAGHRGATGCSRRALPARLPRRRSRSR